MILIPALRELDVHRTIPDDARILLKHLSLHYGSSQYWQKQEVSEFSYFPIVPC